MYFMNTYFIDPIATKSVFFSLFLFLLFSFFFHCTYILVVLCSLDFNVFQK
jgi:hypothetical protein